MEHQIIGWVFSQVGFWILSGIFGSLIVAWIMGFFDHEPIKSKEDIEWERERERKYREENPKESIWPILILVIIAGWLVFS